MPTWSQPEDLRSWLGRGFSLRGGVLLLAVLAILISEVRFSWVEILMGRYLAATNGHRPESDDTRWANLVSANDGACTCRTSWR